MRFWRVVAIIFTASVFLLPSAWAEKRIALVVGVSEYGQDREAREKDGFIVPGALANAVRDSQRIATALKAQDFEVTHLKNPNKRRLRKAISDFSLALSAEDEQVTALFYFAGHGAQGRPAFERDIDNYLIPIGADLITEVDLEDEALGLSRISEALTPGDDDAVIMVLDACRDFALPQRNRSSMTTRGLAEQRARPGTMIAYSTSPGAVAYDGDPGGNGPYASALAKQIEGAKGSRLEDIFISVRLSVLADTAARQVPWENSSLTRPISLGEAPANPLAMARPVEPTRKAQYLFERDDEANTVTLLAKVNGLTYTLKEYEYSIPGVELEQDFNGDGTLDAVISIHGGGNCCPASYAFVIDMGDGHFVVEDIPDVYDWFGPEAEFKDGEWTARFLSVNEGMNTMDYGETITYYTVRGAKPYKISESVNQEVRALAELRSSVFDYDLDSETETRTIKHDLNNDGVVDTITCGFWSRWGRLAGCTAAVSGKDDEIDISDTCKRLGVVDIEKNGMLSLVCDADDLLSYEPAQKAYVNASEG